MALEDKDFIIRQIKTLAKGLGMLLSKDSLKEFINYEQSQQESLSDTEIEQIILLADVAAKAAALGLTQEELAQRLGMSLSRWLELETGDGMPTAVEQAQLEIFLTGALDQ